jgi:hypothetical protein
MLTQERSHGRYVSEYRREIARRSSIRFVEREEYLALITSMRKLERADDYTAELRGLLDRSSGERFVIEEERLFPAELAA